MPHEPKLTVYKIKLKKTSERVPYNHNKWLFRNKINQANTEPLEDGFLFLEVFRLFLEALDRDEMYEDSASFKCITANQAATLSNGVTSITVHSESNIIEGKIEGGTYGRKRNKTSIFNKADKAAVTERDAITEDFYFFYYAPYTSSTSILMLQSYTDDSIDSVMKKFWKNFLSHPSAFLQPKIEKYVPKSIIEDFKKNSKVSNFVYTTEVPSSSLLDPSIQDMQKLFKVSISISPDDSLTIEEYENAVQSLGRNGFSNSLLLDQFENKKGTLVDAITKKSSQFELDSEFEVEPVIFLSKYIEISGDENDFERYKDYCFDLLEKIRPEIYPQDAVQER